MCITFFWLSDNSDSKVRMVLLFNRDEWVTKKSLPLCYWPDCEDVLGGYDPRSKGSWLGVNTKNGNIAFLTNYEFGDPSEVSSGKYTRGNLIKEFLKSPEGVSETDELRESFEFFLSNTERIRGVNLVHGNLKMGEALYASNY